MKIKPNPLVFLALTLVITPLSLIHAETFMIESCPASTDLFEHMSAQVDDRIQGITANNTSKQLYLTRGNLTSPWVKNLNVWTNNISPIDFTGMSPWNSRGGYTRAGTLITPRHIALAHHYLLSVGDTVLFVAEDNTIVTRTVSAVQRVLSSDISIAKLNSDVPNTIAHYPIMDDVTYEQYLNDGYNIGDYSNPRLPIVVFDQEDKALIKDTGKQRLFVDSSILHFNGRDDRNNFNETLIGGDSGNPGFVLIGGKPVLVLTHYSQSSGPSYSYYREDIQDVINSMGGEHQLSTIDLDCFNAPIVLENNTTLKVTENVEVGTSVGIIDIKYNVENDTPYFSILSGNEDGALVINSSTGVITVADSELMQQPYFPRNIEISVEENGEGGRMSKNSYTINIATYPYFDVENYSFDIDEHSANTTVIGDINAFDLQNDTLGYSITAGNEADIFFINSATGVITVANSNLLNYETATSHTLTIRATEDTLQQLSADIEVTINLNDIDYEFTQGSYTFEIAELDENATVVGTVDSDIVDSLDVASTYYSIISGNDNGIFAINSTTGQITIADNAALDGNQIYNIVIGVGEEANSPVLNSAPVTVQVTHVGRPTLSYQAQQTSLVRYEVEEGSSVSLLFELSGSYTKTIVATLAQTLGAATSGSDYSLSTNTLTFLPGETSKTVTLSALSDSVAENDETALIAIMDDTRVSFGPRANATITIKNKARSSGGGGGGGSSSTSADKEEETEEESEEVLEPTSEEPSLIPQTLPTTIEGLMSLLSQLQAQLQSLLSQTSAVSQSLYTTTSSFTRDLELNTQGEDVRQLQQLLLSKGYTIPAGATGFFGEQTRQALIQFQQANNITPAVGYFGPVTRGRIGE